MWEPNWEESAQHSTREWRLQMTREELKTRCQALASVGDNQARSTLELIAAYEANEQLLESVQKHMEKGGQSAEEVAAAATRHANGLKATTDPAVFQGTRDVAGHKSQGSGV